MKKILIISVLFLSIYSTNGQTYNLSDRVRKLPGTYHQDTNNIFGSFTGTWLYSISNPDGTITSLKIELRKLEHQQFPGTDGPYYEDVIVGAYQYIDHNIEIINTLPLFYANVPYWQYNISGNHIIPSHQKPICSECSTAEKRVELGYSEPDRRFISSSMVFRRTVNSAGEAILTLLLYQRNHFISENGSTPQFTSTRIPSGNYVLVHQN